MLHMSQNNQNRQEKGGYCIVPKKSCVYEHIRVYVYIYFMPQYDWFYSKVNG